MVLRGQFLERPTVVQSEGCFLEALWHRGERRPALLVLAPHPARGGSSMDSPLCAELAFAASQRGHPSLRFNWRGAGASQGPLSGELPACLEDARAALAALRQNVGHSEIVVAGYDFGAEIAVELALAGEELKAVAVIAPVSATYDFSKLAGLPIPGLVIAGSKDPLSDRRALSALCQGSGDELLVIPGADHFFQVGLTVAGRGVAFFLAGERAGDALE